MRFHRHLCIALFLLFTSNETLANLRKPNFLPSETPNFSVVETGTNYVTIRYERMDRDSAVRDRVTGFVAIPVSATPEIELSAWDFELFERSELVGRYTKADQAPSLDRTEQEEFVESTIETNRYAFQEIDVYAFSINPEATRNKKGTNNQAMAYKVSLLSFEMIVRWAEGDAKPITQTPRQDAGYAHLFASFCMNQEQIPSLRRKRVLPEEEKTQGFSPLMIGYASEGELYNEAVSPVPVYSEGVRFTVRKTGVLILPVRDLINAGVDPSTVNLAQLRMWHRGEEQPCFIKDDGDGQLEPGEGVVFYGVESDSEYTADSTYYLTWHTMPDPPKRVEQKPLPFVDSGSPVFTAWGVLDEERVLVQKRMGDFSWYFLEMDEKDKFVALDCPDIMGEGEVEVHFSVLNKMATTCAFSVSIEDTTSEYSVRVGSSSTFVFRAPASSFVASPTLAIRQKTALQNISYRSTGASEKVENVPRLFFKHFEYTYPRTAIVRGTPLILTREVMTPAQTALAVTVEEPQGNVSAWVVKNNQVQYLLEANALSEPMAMQTPREEWDRIEIHSTENYPENHSVFRAYPSSLHRTDQGYDYVIIAYHTFMQEARALAARRTLQGFTVLLTDVQDIYDEFNYGYPDPDAIVRFLRYAQSEWSGLSPEFVVLIGDSSWDHRDREKTGCVDQIPAYTPVNDPQRFGEDDFYTQLWGGPLDYFADVILGRISVREPEELVDYLTKVAVYEDANPVGVWKMKNQFITDNSFERYAHIAAEESLPSWLMPDHIHQAEFPHFTNSIFFNKFKNIPDPSLRQYLNKKLAPGCTEAIIDSFDDGALISQYIGHGGNQLWSHERIFYGTNRSYSDVRRLQPNTKFPFIMNWSCLTGYLNFNIPPFNVCLAEELLRFPDRGGIAIFAPSGGGSTEYHMLLLHMNMRNLFRTDLARFGEAVTQTKIEFLLKNNSPEMTKQYILFGDPAVAVARPQERVDLSVSPTSFVNADDQTFTVRAALESMETGKAVVHFSVGGKTIYQSEDLSFSNGQFRASFPVSIEGVKNATASVGMYAWNESDNVDAWGGAEVAFFKPELVLHSESATRKGDELFLRFHIENVSRFPLAQVNCKVFADTQKFTVPVASIPANSTVTVSWQGNVSGDVSHLFCGIEGNAALNIEETDVFNYLSVPVDDFAAAPVVPLFAKMTYSSNEPTELKTTQFHIPVMNVSSATFSNLAFSLEGPGSVTKEQMVTLVPGEEQRIRFSVKLPEKGTYPYSLVSKVDGEVYSHTFPVDVVERPDLVLLEEGFVVDPPHPVVGRTVIFHVTVANIGNSVAKNIDIQAYDGDPKFGQKMDNFDGTHSARLLQLAPGEQAAVSLVWDPVSYDGAGEHEVHIVVDRHKRIDETDDTNNTLIKKIVLHDLPDLAVDPVGDHSFTLPKTEDPVKLWGQPMKIFARMKNVGASDAEFSRMTILYNQQEIHKYFDRTPVGKANETTFAVPLVSAKNQLMTHADKYDLIGEQDDYGNNISFPKRMYVQLRMPEAAIEQGVRRYAVREETQFSAGDGDYVMYDQKKGALVMIPNMDDVRQRLIPEFVQDKSSYVTVLSRLKWQWSMPFNAFVSPTGKPERLDLVVPAPKGLYDLYLDLYSEVYKDGGTETIQYKAVGDAEFITLEHHARNRNEKNFVGIGTYRIEEDRIPLSLMGMVTDHFTSVGDIRFRRSSESERVSSGYTSPLFPASGSGHAPAEMSWEAYLPKNTHVRFKARWVDRKGNAYEYKPWSEYVDDRPQRLALSGKGDFIQYYVDFVRETSKLDSPQLRSVSIHIPCSGS
jgi:hypothetical protein